MRADENRYRHWVVAALACTYMFNFLDRQLLSVLAEPIKLDLRLSDTQLGALTGLTFALFYTLFGIPVAALADRGNRVRLVAIACGLWSLFTVATGFAGSFLALVIARVGVGIGEAGGSPPSYSIISDYFPRHRRGSALAAYSMGVPFGSLVGVGAGGWIAVHYGWRAAFIAIGAIGLVLAPLILRVVREPERGRYDEALEKSLGELQPSVAGALIFFARSPILLLNALSSGAMAFVGYGVMNWAPAYLLRVQGMTLSQLAASYSVVAAVAIASGILLGGLMVDRFGAKNRALGVAIPGIGFLLMAPFLFGFTLAGTWQTSLAFVVGPLVLSGVYFAPALALVQNRTPTCYRATASALLLFVLNLIGLGCGPLFVGALSDRLQPQYGANALGMALQWLTPFVILAFITQCATAWAVGREGAK